LAKLLIARGANPKSLTKKRNLPLHFVTDLPLAQLYVKQYKVNVNARNIYGQTPLHKAIRAGASKTYINGLLDLGADFTASTNLGETPLHYAASNGDAALMRLLVKYASEYATDTLHLSVSNAAAYVKKYILKEDDKGRTALMLINVFKDDEFKDVAAFLQTMQG
jgi:ankyrin repeat protein